MNPIQVFSKGITGKGSKTCSASSVWSCDLVTLVLGLTSCQCYIQLADGTKMTADCKLLA